MEAGRTLDALIAEKVMEWNLNRYVESMQPSLLYPKAEFEAGVDDWEQVNSMIKVPKGLLPRYSTDIAAAWEVVEKLGLLNRYVLNNKAGVWKVLEVCDYDFSDSDCMGEGLTAPHAICLAALKAIG